MRAILKKVLTDPQFKALVRFKKKTIPNLRYRLGQSPFLLLGSVVKIMPDNSLVTLKSGINIVKKMDYQRRDIFLTVDSDMEYKVRLHSCEKEPDTVEWIETFVKEGDVLYDVGANVGAYTLLASKLFAGNVKVFAFEPAFLNFSQLCKNLLLNECQDSVTPFQVALSDETGIQTFNFHNLIPGGAVHTLGEAVDQEGDSFIPAATQPVLSFRTDDFMRQFQLPAPNHIKIDVDGTELLVLKGMSGILAEGSVRSIMLELSPGEEHRQRIMDFLSSNGFKVHSTYGLNHLLVPRG